MSALRRLARLVALGAVAAVLLVLAGALPAQAHAAVVSVTPAPGSTVRAAPSAVTLVFDEDLLDLGRNAIGVTDPAGRQVATACATVDGDRLSVPVRLGGSGVYRVVWRASSADGHAVGSTYTFRYRAPAGAGTSPTPSPAPASCAPTGAAAAPATPGLPVPVLVAVVASGAVLAAVVVVAVLVLVAVRRADRARGGAAPVDDGGSPP